MLLPAQTATVAGRYVHSIRGGVNFAELLDGPSAQLRIASTLPALFRRAVSYVDRKLRGKKAEQTSSSAADQFELIINVELRVPAAKHFGRVSQTCLTRLMIKILQFRGKSRWVAGLKAGVPRLIAAGNSEASANCTIQP
jgi:hypothetical protein